MFWITIHYCKIEIQYTHSHLSVHDGQTDRQTNGQTYTVHMGCKKLKKDVYKYIVFKPYIILLIIINYMKCWKYLVFFFNY